MRFTPVSSVGSQHAVRNLTTLPRFAAETIPQKIIQYSHPLPQPSQTPDDQRSVFGKLAIALGVVGILLMVGSALRQLFNSSATPPVESVKEEDASEL